MKGGDWIWILIALFGVIRLLMLAGKKKKAGDAPPPHPTREPGPRPAQGGVDELKKFIDMLSGKVKPDIRRTDDYSRTGEPQPEEFHPPPPRPTRRPPARKPAGTPPRVIPRLPVQVEIAPVEQGIGTRFNFSRNPVIQGIIFSEILSPPRGLAGRTRLPSDPPV